MEMKILYSLIDDVAKRQGDSTALIYYPPGRTKADIFSYRNYVDGINRLIGWLRALGIGESDAVAYLLPDSPTTAMLSCAIQSVGIALELDIWAQPQQVLAVLEVTRPKLIVCGSDGTNPGLVETHREIVNAFGGRARIGSIDSEEIKNTSFRFGADGIDAAAFAGAAPVPPLNPDLERTVFYRLTGGTTGQPKIIPQSAKKLLASILITLPFQNLGPDSVLLMGFTTFYTYYMPSGVQVVIRGIDILAGQVRGLDHNILIEHNVTHISVTPHFISVIASRDETLTAIAHHPINVASTGGRLLPGHYQQLKKIGVAKVFNFYGASEAGLIAFQEIDNAADVGCFENIRPGHAVRIVDEDGEELPAGKVGSLSISGGDVFVGKYGDGGHTAELQREWHLTGDLAKFDAAGRLVILGRNFRGVRISSSTNFLDGEFLEAALAEHETIQFASIVALESLGIAPFIGIFVCPADAAMLSENEVVSLFHRHIGNQALVAEVKAFILSALPMTPRGKVDRMRLIKAAIEYLYTRTLSAAIADESFNLMAGDDDELLLSIVVGRADKMPIAPQLAQRVRDVLSMSPYRIHVV